MTINLSAFQQQRRDTAANWTSQDPTLKAGEIGYETDTGYIKVGDGSTAWTSLAYIHGTKVSAYPLATVDIANDAITGDKLANDITIANDLTVTNNLTVNGTTTTIDTTTLTVEDKNIELGTVATPSDTTADGGGITLKGATDKTINWVQSTGCWTFNQPTNFNNHVRIDSSGRLLLGRTSSLTDAGYTSNLQVEASSAGNAAVSIINTSNDAFSGGVINYKSRGSSSVQNNDSLGQFRFTGHDGTGYIQGVRIEAAVDGTPGTNDMPGRLMFATSADGTSSPTERMRINSSGGVGIGTSSPSTMLHVAGVTRVGADNTSDAELQVGAGATGNRNAIIDLVGDTTYTDYGFRVIRDNGGANTSSRLLHRGTGDLRIIAQEAAPMQFWTSNVERMRVDSSGKLGIGTSSPSEKLHVYGDTNATIRVAKSGGANVYLSQNSDNSATLYNDGQGPLRIRTYQSQPVIFYTNNDDKMRILPNGNVGIGTDNPARVLHVKGTPSIVSRFESSAANYGGIDLKDANTTADFKVQLAASGDDLVSFAGGLERLRLDSSGRLLVGTSSAIASANNSGGNRLCLSGSQTFFRSSSDTNSQYIEFVKQRSSGTIVSSGDRLGQILFEGHDGSNPIKAAEIASFVDGTPGSTDMPGRLVFSTTADGASNPTEHFRIASNGDLTATDTTIGSNSDSRLKTNIADFAYDLETFKQYQPKTFDWKNPELHGNKTSQRGFIAQDVEAVDAYWVGQQAVDEDSADAEFLDADRLAKTLKLDKKDAMYVSVIQQLLAKVETLEAKVAALEAD